MKLKYQNLAYRRQTFEVKVLSYYKFKTFYEAVSTNKPSIQYLNSLKCISHYIVDRTRGSFAVETEFLPQCYQL